MPVVQTLEFNAVTQNTISCKLLAKGTDTVVQTQTATEKTNDKNRYYVAFQDVPAGKYRLNGFVAGAGGYANEDYDLTFETKTFYPLSESTVDLTAITDQLDDIQAKTDLIGTGSATVSVPVTPEGTIDSPIIIGDDYLDTNGRAFVWTVAKPTGFSLVGAVTKFGGKNSQGDGWLVTGSISDNGNNTLDLTFELLKEDTQDLDSVDYQWSVEIRDSGGVEITKVRSGRHTVKLAAKQT